MDFRGGCSGRGVVVAPGQVLFTLALGVVGEDAGVTGAVRDEEGTSLGSKEGGISCGAGSSDGLQDGTAANAGICVVILL